MPPSLLRPPTSGRPSLFDNTYGIDGRRTIFDAFAVGPVDPPSPTDQSDNESDFYRGLHTRFLEDRAAEATDAYTRNSLRQGRADEADAERINNGQWRTAELDDGTPTTILDLDVDSEETVSEDPVRPHADWFGWGPWLGEFLDPTLNPALEDTPPLTPRW